MPKPPAPLPPLAPIVARLQAQLGHEPGQGRLTREDVIVLAILAVERDATAAWTVHKAGCAIHEKAGWLRRCTCGLETAENRSFTLRQALEPRPDLRRRGKQGQDR